MISFCDIPIGNSAEHSSKYGGYAIGLSKEYLINEYSFGLGPVNYFTSDKTIQAAFKLKEIAQNNKKALHSIGKQSKGQALSVLINGQKYVGKTLSTEDAPKALQLFFQGDDYYRAATFAIRLMKRYKSMHNGIYQINYDECEWRMVMPENAKLGNGELCKWFWTEKEYDNWRASTDDKFIHDWSLPFTVDDIQYLVVPSKKIIPNFIKRLTKLTALCGLSLSDKDKYSLVSKVISMDQIKNDF